MFNESVTTQTQSEDNMFQKADDYAMLSESPLLNAPRKSQLYYYKQESGSSNDNEFYDTSNFERHMDSIIKTNKFEIESPEPRRLREAQFMSTRSCTDSEDEMSEPQDRRHNELIPVVSAFSL